MAKVSVIVPVYNVEQYLEKCFDSLKNQTLKDLEVIIVNDGSTDSSQNIIDKYVKENTNFKSYIKPNGGLSDARNYGLQYVTSPYVAFLDSDDYVETTIYEKMYEEAIKDNKDFVECDFIWEYPDKQRIDTRIDYSNNKEMLVYGRVVAWNKLIKTSIIKELFPKGKHYEDIEFFYKLIPEIKSFGYVNEPLIHYIQRDNSIVNKQDLRTEEIFDIFDSVFKYFKDNNLYDDYKNELEFSYTRILLCSSFKRMCKIKDKSDKKKALTDTYNRLNETFPNWKNNKYLRDTKDKRFKSKKKYMKAINKLTYKIFSIIYSF